MRQTMMAYERVGVWVHSFLTLSTRWGLVTSFTLDTHHRIGPVGSTARLDAVEKRKSLSLNPSSPVIKLTEVSLIQATVLKSVTKKVHFLLVSPFLLL
jgi:hypothetical protein